MAIKRPLGTNNRNGGSSSGSSSSGSSRSGNAGSARDDFWNQHPNGLPQTLDEIIAANRQADINKLGGSSKYFDNVLAMLGNNSNASDFLNMLLGIGADNAGTIGTFPDDFRQKLIQLFLDNLVKSEQRDYDKGVLGEQRVYDSPMNQLARLMGAGISRDAAIQMLQGSDSGSLIGSGAESDSGEPMTPVTQQAIQAVQTAVGAIGAVGSMVSLGFTIPQALQQTHFLKNQNFLSDQQKSAYQMASKAFGILNGAGSAAEAFDSTASAISSIQSLAASGNKPATDFIQQGGIEKMQEVSPFVSPVLSTMYRNEHDSEMLRNEIRRQNLSNDLIKADEEKTYNDIYVGLSQVLDVDERIKLYRQQILESKSRTKINDAVATQEEYGAAYAEFQGDILKKLTTYVDGDGNSVTDIMSRKEFDEAWMSLQYVAMYQKQPEKFDKWLQDNWNAACDLAVINQIYANRHKLQLEDPSILAGLMSFAKMMDESGLGAMVDRTVQAGLKGAELLKPVPRLR